MNQSFLNGNPMEYQGTQQMLQREGYDSDADYVDMFEQENLEQENTKTKVTFSLNPGRFIYIITCFRKNQTVVLLQKLLINKQDDLLPSLNSTQQFMINPRKITRMLIKSI